MGSVTSRIPLPFLRKKSPEEYKKELEDINKQIYDLEKRKSALHHQYGVVLELISTYSRVLYVIVALVFFFTTLPSSLVEYILFCGPLVIFYFLVYMLKAAVKWYYENEVQRGIDNVKKLKFKKKTLLTKVKETTPYKEAKDILEKYDKPVIVDRKVVRREKQEGTCYIDNVVSYVLGEQKKNSLVCIYCQWHNGMALEEERDFIGFRCCRCYKMNKPLKQRSSEKHDCCDKVQQSQ